MAEEMVLVTRTVVLLLLFGGRKVWSECGERLGKGIVMCQFEETDNIEPFDFELCTHVNVGTTTFLCDGKVCWPNNSTGFERLVKWVQPNLPKTIGLRVDFNQAFIDQISSRIIRSNTAKRLISFVEERGMSFFYFTEATSSNSFINTLNRSSLLFIEEIARAVHQRGWHIGLALDVGHSELQAKYDFGKLSRFVDWFRLFPVKLWTDEKYMQPFLPVSSKIDPIGTTEYWIKHVLQWLKPECLLIHVHIVGIKYTAEEVYVDPGPRSFAAKGSRAFIYVWDVCETTALTTCNSFWDDDSGTPWATCGDDYYSYVDPRSMELRTKLAKDYGIAGMSILGSIHSSGSSSCGHEDEFVFFRATQGIRNSTDRSLEVVK